MRWLLLILLAMPVSLTSCRECAAQVTSDQLATQSQVVAGALLQYNLANDEMQNLYRLQNAAWQEWQLYKYMAVLFYQGGAYDRGLYYHSVAFAAEQEHHRLTALIATKKVDVEAKWQTYLREFERLQAMLAAYRGN